eukprot:1990932-Rhodomonas_salina.1
MSRDHFQPLLLPRSQTSALLRPLRMALLSGRRARKSQGERMSYGMVGTGEWSRSGGRLVGGSGRDRGTAEGNKRGRHLDCHRRRGRRRSLPVTILHAAKDLSSDEGKGRKLVKSGRS